MKFFRQEYWNELPPPPPGALPDPGIEPTSPALQADFYLLGPWGSSVNGMEPLQISLVQSLSPTLCDPMDCSTPGLPVHHQLPEFTQTHVH